jgi:hypothetical protein
MMVVLTSCSKSQDISIKDWSAIQYYYSSGPLPPPYHFSYEITINNGGSSMLNYYLGYDNKAPLIYNFTVSQEDLKQLEDKIVNSNLISGKIESLAENKHPVGGSLNKAKLIIADPNPDLDQPPRVIESPYFPKEEFKENLQELYEFLKKLVPADVWLDVNGKTTEYEANNKK